MSGYRSLLHLHTFRWSFAPVHNSRAASEIAHDMHAERLSFSNVTLSDQDIHLALLVELQKLLLLIATQASAGLLARW